MNADKLILLLKELYPPGKFHTGDPFRVLITTVLSQRTRDEMTEKAADKLFSRYGTPAELSQADVRDIEELIRDAGFYRMKAPRIKEIARIIDNELNGRVPDTLDGLLLFPGVGRKTANCVLVYGFGRDAIAVDTHVHRISNRLGFVRTDTPEETELALLKIIPKEHWRHINELLVRFGKEICRPVAPKCRECTIYDMCPTGKDHTESIDES